LQKQVAIDSNNNSPPLIDEPSPSGLGEICICLLAPFVSTVTWCRLRELLMVADIFIQEEFFAWEANEFVNSVICRIWVPAQSKCAF
jgi:hypothetical protein